MRIELTSSAWKADILAIIRHRRKKEAFLRRRFTNPSRLCSLLLPNPKKMKPKEGCFLFLQSSVNLWVEKHNIHNTHWNYFDSMIATSTHSCGRATQLKVRRQTFGCGPRSRTGPSDNETEMLPLHQPAVPRSCFITGKNSSKKNCLIYFAFLYFYKAFRTKPHIGTSSRHCRTHFRKW